MDLAFPDKSYSTKQQVKGWWHSLLWSESKESWQLTEKIISFRDTFEELL